MCTGSRTVGNRSRGPWSHGRGARSAKVGVESCFIHSSWQSSFFSRVFQSFSPERKTNRRFRGQTWCTEWACEQEGRPWGTGTNHGDEAVFAREGEAQLHAVQPVFSRQGETQLRKVQPLPPLQAERHMQRVQNGARGSAEFEAGQARAAEFAGTKARAGDRDQARTFRQSKRARHRRVIGVIYQAIGKSDW